MIERFDSICLNLVYIETLLYIVHVDDIDLPVSIENEINEEMYDGGDEQQSIPSTKVFRRLSKRTTASFNERHQFKKEAICPRSSFTFSNPLRRLNSKTKSFIENTCPVFVSNLGLLKSNEKITQIPSTPKRIGIDFPLYSSTVKKSSSFNNQSQPQNQNNNDDQDKLFPPPPPPSFFHENPTEQRPIIRAIGPGLTDGFVNENCAYFDWI